MMRNGAIRTVALLLGGLATMALYAGGCAGPRLVGRTQDTNPLLKQDHVSEGIAIPFKDSQIIANAGQAVDPAGRPGYASTGAQYYHPTFHQSAIFEAQSTDHLVFVVELANRWVELTHAENYEIELVDDQGHHYHPVAIEGRPARIIRQTMNLGRSDVVHMVVNGPGGTQVFTHAEEANSGDVKAMLAARASIAFHSPGLLSPQTRRLTLLLHHPNRQLEFTWEFR
jgi:hypothetical protein